MYKDDYTKVSADLETYLSYFPVVGIVGPRQVGKTTLVKDLITYSEKKYIYLDLEFPEDLNKLSDPALYLSNSPDKCIIIDEVQRKPELFPVIRSLVDQDRRPGRFILLGSASPELIRDTSESLAGRIAYMEMTPFNRIEVFDYSQNDHWFRGGFPESLLAPDLRLSRIWLDQFTRTYIERDLPLLGFPASPSITRRFWQMLAHHTGNLLNSSQFANAMGLSVPTIKRYLDFFEHAFLIRLLQPYAQNSKKRLTKSPKIYIRDTGLLHHLAGLTNLDALQGHMLVGASWEAYVIEQIAQLVPSEVDLYFYRTSAGAEVDLLISRGGQILALVEVKYSSSPSITRGFWNTMDELESHNNYIITPTSTDGYQLSKKVTVMGLDAFINQVVIICTSLLL